MDTTFFDGFFKILYPILEVKKWNGGINDFPKNQLAHKKVGGNGECLCIAFTKLSMFFFVPHRFLKGTL